jgi:uncharacterized repeat protein (TIGR03843 family)
MREDGGVSELDVTTALTLLRQGDISVAGRLVHASNTTLFCDISHCGVEARCVYKPVAGERPLWDFPDGSLAGREVASYAVSEAAGWGVVPPTVLREGPLGPGMVQLWVETIADVDLVDLVAPDSVPTGWLRVLDALGSGGRPVVLAHADDDRLRRMAVFDVVINNADRKGGHVLPLPDGTVRGVDHGVTFHREPKLRTVLWGWAGEPLRDEEGAILTRLGERLSGDLGTELAELLTRAEVRETHRRIARLVTDGRLPFPSESWPAIPWPPF